MQIKYFWFVLILITQVVYGSDLFEADQEVYHYRADYFARNPNENSFRMHYSFIGSEVHSSESDVIEFFGGCSREGSSLKIHSSLVWLNFKVDLEANPQSFETAKEQEVVFNYDSIFLGENIIVIGVKQVSESFTIIYYSPKKGILGLSWLNVPIKELVETFIQPVFWLEGSKGICHEKER